MTDYVNKRTKVYKGKNLNWNPMSEHIELYHREIAKASDANEMGIRLSSVLWEKIDVGGAVLPHYHDVAEIIHITKGRVKLLFNGEWTEFEEGDTFLVPAGTVHSVKNNDTVPTEQISIFIPCSKEKPENKFFNTYMVKG